MITRNPHPRMPSFGGLGGPPPRDIVILLAVLLFTFSLRFFSSTEALPALLELRSEGWRSGFLWQLVTYAFVGRGGGGLWFVIELFILYLFGRDVWITLGRRRARRLIGIVVVSAAVLAVLVDALAGFVGHQVRPPFQPFDLIQGQHMLVVILIAAFATLHRHATIYLFFVLPIQARWFLWLEVLFGFLAYLPSHDIAGFVGLLTGVVLTTSLLRPGGPRRFLREIWLRGQHRVLRAKLDRERRRRKLRVVPDPDRPPRDSTIH
ncbi:MAG: hypothetical protein AAF481_03395 [Acidobacteriota bacterium]